MLNEKQEKSDYLILEMLDTIDNDPSVSQRQLASQLGIALGLTNAYLQDCVFKGYVQKDEQSSSRVQYLLSEQGAIEKSRLTSLCLQRGFSFQRAISENIAEFFKDSISRGKPRWLLYGLSELTELAVINLSRYPVKITAIIEPYCDIEKLFDIPVLDALPALSEYDNILLTDTDAPQVSYEYLIERVAKECLHVPDILRVKQ